MPKKIYVLRNMSNVDLDRAGNCHAHREITYKNFIPSPLRRRLNFWKSIVTCHEIQYALKIHRNSIQHQTDNLENQRSFSFMALRNKMSITVG